MRFESIKHIERANFHINFSNTIVQKKPHPNEKKNHRERLKFQTLLHEKKPIILTQARNPSAFSGSQGLVNNKCERGPPPGPPLGLPRMVLVSP